MRLSSGACAVLEAEVGFPTSLRGLNVNVLGKSFMLSLVTRVGMIFFNHSGISCQFLLSLPYPVVSGCQIPHFFSYGVKQLSPLFVTFVQIFKFRALSVFFLVSS